MWFSAFLLLLVACAVSPLNPYGKHKVVTYDGVDAGEPLILTPYIKSGNISVARSLANVTLDEFEGVESYSGYFMVNETYNSNLFFWFFPSADNYDEDPILLWLQGGPGASSLGGLFLENGPFDLDKSEGIKKRNHSWHRKHSVLYIDNPVAVGFSFTDHEEGLASTEVLVGEHLYRALLQFFQLFPEIQKNPFFVTGESYAGKYVPAISYTIHNKNPDSDVKINLKGFAIGNGITDPIHQYPSYGRYLHAIGLIDKRSKTSMEDIANTIVEHIENEDWMNAVMQYTNMMQVFHKESGYSNVYNFLYPEDYIQFESITDFLNKRDVRSAIHVGNKTFRAITRDIYIDLLEDIPQSVTPWVSELLNHYRGLFYVGQLDIICNYQGVLNFLQHLNFSSAEEYKAAKRKIWYDVSGDAYNPVAGYVKTAGNMSEVLVRNAGHMVPRDQPKWALELITRFTRNDLNTLTLLGDINNYITTENVDEDVYLPY